MRFCGARHDACHMELSSHDKKDNPPPNRLKVGVLTACRQVYVETNPILWSTNTWSFDNNDTWRCWLSKMNANQKRLIKKVHLCQGVVFDFMTKPTISALKGLEELNVDIFTWNRPQQSKFEHPCPQCLTSVLITLVNQFFQAERIAVIANDGWKTSNDCLLIKPATFEERVATAEACRVHLITFQNKAGPKKKEKGANLLTKGEKSTDEENGTEVGGRSEDEDSFGESEN
jgi:hypothetical protein